LGAVSTTKGVNWPGQPAAHTPAFPRVGSLNVAVRILSEHEVRRLLTPAACADRMAEVLAALARGELYNPLRAMLRPPGERTVIALMPAHRGGADPLYSLKAICVAPGNTARGLDSHQGFVALFDGETGAPRAIMHAGAITSIRTAAVSGVATRLLARPGSRTLAILGFGIQGRAHLDAMRVAFPFESVRVWSRSPVDASSLDGVDVAVTAEEAVRGADVVVTATSSSEPILERGWLAEGAHVNAVGSSIPTARELDSATMAAAALFVDRRESTVNEAGDYLFPLREGAIGPDHIRAEIGEVLTGAAEGRRDDAELTVFKSLGLAVEDLAAAEHVLREAEAEGGGVEVDFGL
jgi:ornithine cyclodeaminase